MRQSRTEKARSHQRIVEIASRRLRERGLDGIGIADLMKEAGLTVGGFYKHFASRDELVAAAVESSFGLWTGRAEAAAERGETLTLAELADDYLNPSHRDNPGSGCPFAALACDLARADPATRGLATRQIARNLDLLAGLVPEPAVPRPDQPADRAAARRAAILAFSAMVGAVALSRVVDDGELSREILTAVRESMEQAAEC